MGALKVLLCRAPGFTIHCYFIISHTIEVFRFRQARGDGGRLVIDEGRFS